MRMILPRTLVALLAVLTIVLTDQVLFSLDVCGPYFDTALMIWYLAPLFLIAALGWLVVWTASLFEQLLALGVMFLLMMAYLAAGFLMKFGMSMAQSSCY
jgi:hypothetical protein